MKSDPVELPEVLFIYSGKGKRERGQEGWGIGKERGKKKQRQERGSYAVSIPEPSGPVGMAPAGWARRFIHSMM